MATRYHKHAHYQRQIAAELLDRIALPTQPASILEVGCGTGFLTHLLVDRFPEATIDAVDLSGEMIDLARQKVPSPQVHWRMEDMNSLDMNWQVDLVASSTALHWGNPIDRLVWRLARMLRPGGTMIAAVMTAGTLEELHQIRREIAPGQPPSRRLPSFQILEQACAKARLKIDDLTTVETRRQFSSARELIRELSRSGFTGGPFALASGKPLVRSRLDQLIASYQQRYGDSSGAVHATFKVTYLAAAVAEI